MAAALTHIRFLYTLCCVNVFGQHRTSDVRLLSWKTKKTLKRSIGPSFLLCALRFSVFRTSYTRPVLAYASPRLFRLCCTASIKQARRLIQKDSQHLSLKRDSHLLFIVEYCPTHQK